jgi:hypothetical protein
MTTKPKTKRARKTVRQVALENVPDQETLDQRFVAAGYEPPAAPKTKRELRAEAYERMRAAFQLDPSLTGGWEKILAVYQHRIKEIEA